MLHDQQRKRAIATEPPTHPTVKALPTTLDEWTDALATALAKSQNGKAAGMDNITHQAVKAAGPPFAVAVARCLQGLAQLLVMPHIVMHAHNW